MDAVRVIKERRSVRKFKEEKVDRQLIKEIIATATYAPTWANSQTVRYTIVDCQKTLTKLANEAFTNFKHNKSIVEKAAGLIVVSNVKGKSGRSPKGEIVTAKGDAWEMFDAGIASQTLCLAAYDKGIGTVILGIFDEAKVAEIIDLPAEETIAALIPYGYETVHPKAPPRKPVSEIIRFI